MNWGRCSKLGTRMDPKYNPRKRFIDASTTLKLLRNSNEIAPSMGNRNGKHLLDSDPTPHVRSYHSCAQYSSENTPRHMPQDIPPAALLIRSFFSSGSCPSTIIQDTPRIASALGFWESISSVTCNNEWMYVAFELMSV